MLVTLWGGFDGLSALPPVGDPNYALARPTIAVAPTAALPLDRVFGMHPSMAPLMPWWQAGKLAAVQAVGVPYATRSHFQAQAELGKAAPGTSISSGWLNRVAARFSPPDALNTVQVGDSVLVSSLLGPAPVTTLWQVNDFALVGAQWTGPVLGATLAQMYGSVSSPLSGTALGTLQACAGLAPLQNTTYVPAPGASYPSSGLGAALSGVAQLVKSGSRLRVAAVDTGGWDLHADLGNGGGGAMAALLADLAAALAAFATDLGPAFDRVTVVTLSEFGRRVAENGSGGTDHGHGNAMFVLGGHVNGGRVYGSWPTLAPGALDDGDLRGTYDYRNVLSEILLRRCGLTSVASIFPQFSPRSLGIVS